MKAQVNKGELLRAAAIAQKGTAGRSSMPILLSLLLEIEGSTLTLTGTDHNTTFKACCEVTEAEPGSLAVPAAHFMDVLRGLPEPVVSLEQVGKQLRVQSGRSKYLVPCFTTTVDFPAVPEIEEPVAFTVAGNVLAAALERVLPAVGTDDTRPQLVGIHLSIPEGGRSLYLVATDTHRLHVARIELGEEFTAPHALAATVPSSVCAELVKLLHGSDDCTIELGKNLVGLSAPWGALFTRLIDGQYPAFRRVIPDHREGLQFDRRGLVEALKRAATVAAGDAHRVVLAQQEDGGFTLSARSEEFGQAEEAIDTLGGNGPTDPLAMNHKQLVAAVAACPEDIVTLRRGNPAYPVLIVGADPEQFLAVVAPMALP
jgi:DNA polymerase-3 subunit beta